MLSKCVALDIDGVILKGGKLLSGAKEAIQLLHNKRIPFVFLTNGGGISETLKAFELSKKVGISFSSDQVVQCHTPMKCLANFYNNKRVLIVGKESCVDVAHSYGFNKAIGIEQYHLENPTVYPLREPKSPNIGTSMSMNNDPIAAAMIFHDPVDWGLEMQILSDVLIDRTGKGAQNIPLYATNADIVYTTEFPYPRFTQGAFVKAFKHLYETFHGQHLTINFYGKPFTAQYEYAENLLLEQAKKLGVPKPTIFFGIGDNPLSDIRGANNAGTKWKSILVRTGIFCDDLKENDDQDPADIVCQDLEAAVKSVLAYEII
jgi:HAD superfamily hydrolase (TIGR01456 family)